jgi:hypothetical protein
MSADNKSTGTIPPGDDLSAFLDGLRDLLAAHPDIARSLAPPAQVKPRPDPVKATREQLLDDLAEVVAEVVGIGQPWTWQLLVRIAVEQGNNDMRRVLDPIQRRCGGTAGHLDPSVLGKLFRVDAPHRRETGKWRFDWVSQSLKRCTWKLERT